MNDNTQPGGHHLQDSTIGSHVIINGNLLVPVPQPEAEYYRCVGYLRTHVSGNGRNRGTGTLIAAGDGYGILTCAHNLYDRGVAGPAERIEFFPAKTGDATPYGVITAESEMLRISPQYRGPQDTSGPYDYAVIRLYPDQVPAGIGPMPEMTSVPIVQLGTVQVTGYPAVTLPRSNQVMYYSRGPVRNDPAATGLLQYASSTLGGSSGSPVCGMRVDREGVDVPVLNAITAVHVDGDADLQINWGVYLTPEIIRWVTSQITG